MFVRPDRAWVVSEVTPEESVQFCGVAQRCIPAGVCVVGVAAAGSMFSIPYHARSLSGEAAAAFHAQDRGCGSGESSTERSARSSIFTPQALLSRRADVFRSQTADRALAATGASETVRKVAIDGVAA
jgi:hypothetical protein